ncbi:MAG: hypothetical protein NZ551_00735 [Microscillaceae bacterium]|nr:hypothetical protein [Microscillaceae bacterium]MDW8459714.1 hypothetical protein [Cytophagales bacterium]
MKRSILLVSLLWGVWLFNFAYAQSPVMKFINGEKKNFKTTQLAKAQGLSLAIDYPKEWKNEEDKQPYVLQKFTRTYDKVTAQVAICMQIIKNADEITQLKEAIQSNSFEQIKPYLALINPEKDITFSQGMTYKIKDADGFWLKGTKKVADNQFIFYKTYFWIFNDRLIILPFSTTGETAEQASKNFSKYESLFKLMLESVFVGN